MSPVSFDGLHASSFDAYRPEKWSSNVFTRERLEVKQRMLVLARELEPIFEAAGLRLQRYASDEYPSLRNGKKVNAQWVFFWRTEEERQILEREVDLEKTLAATLADPTPMTRHAFLCFRLSQDGLETSFRLHCDAWVDRRNLKNKIDSAEHRDELFALLGTLPGRATLRVGAGESIKPSDCTAEILLSLVDEDGAIEQGDGFLRIGVHLERDETIELGADLLSFIKPSLSVIAEIYKFVIWNEQNDFVSKDEKFLERRAERGARRQEHEQRRAARQAAQEAKKKEQVAARQELEELFRREAAARIAAPRRPRPAPAVIEKPDSERSLPRPGERKGARHTKKESLATHKKQNKSTPAKPSTRPVKKPAPREPQPVCAGHEARVTKGPLAGQVGLVQELDAKGSARIMVGLLATRIPIEDLVGLGPVVANPEDNQD